MRRSYSEIIIIAGNQAPAQFRGKSASGSGDTYGSGFGMPVEVLSATKGKMVSDKSLTERNLEEMFAPVKFLI